jgi:hypothetical protein
MADIVNMPTAATDVTDVTQDAAPAISVAALLAAIKDDPAVRKALFESLEDERKASGGDSLAPDSIKRQLDDISDAHESKKRARGMQALIIQPDSATIAHILKGTGPWTLEKVYGFDANARNPDPGQDTAFYLDAMGVRAATKSKAIPNHTALQRVIETVGYYYCNRLDLAKGITWGALESERRRHDFDAFRLITNTLLAKHPLQAVVALINRHIAAMETENANCPLDATYKPELTWADILPSADTFFRTYNAPASPADRDPRPRDQNKAPNGQTICGDFNSPKGCKRPACSYAHFCRACRHPRCQAGQTSCPNRNK